KILARAVMRYVYSFIGQISQNSACLCYHSVEKRLARWLLMLQDRAGGDELKLTQEFIAVMLGVHRPSVSKCAVKLQEQGLISYNRGRIKILDRDGLLKAACECYETIRQISDAADV
ncbi:MAG: Crp/Fnr family transcriptional regulator, partial [Pyrinomonadaceae bacterium]